MTNIIAIIPARGGSKGIAKKNIRLIDGHPLIYYQIKTALESKYINEVYVSTDDKEIAEAASQYEGVKIIDRPEEISGDLAKSEEAIIHAVKHIESTGDKVDIIVFLQATSPLNKASYIDESIEKIKSGCDSVCCTIEDYGFFMDDNDLLERPMRQQHTPRIRECGNFWTMKKEALFKSNNRLSGKIGYVVIDRWDSIEIDEPEDLQLIRTLTQQRNRKESGNYYKERNKDLTADYEEEYWGETIDPDGNVRNKIAERENFIDDAKTVVEYINSLKPGNILDVGCGFGYLLSAVDDKWQKNGVELSNYAAKVAAQYADIYTGDILEAGYKPDSFDIIVLYHVIEHLAEPLKMVNKINELLKVGGKFIVSTPDFESITAERYGENFRLLHDKTHISLFSTQSLINLLVDSGFEVERVEHPYFESRHFNEENLLRLLDTDSMSPPFYGNVVNVYAYKC